MNSLNTCTLSLFLVLVACGPQEDLLDLHTNQSARDLADHSSTIWPTNVIPVCWENAMGTNANGRAWTKAAVERTWEAQTSVRFTG